MTKQFLTDVIQDAGDLTGVAAKRIVATLLDAIQTEILTNGRFTLPGFGTFTLKETPAGKGLNPRTGEPVKVKAGATVRFKAAPNLKTAAFTAVKKTKRKAKNDDNK
jgi:DNA-binding protein HU-beta